MSAAPVRLQLSRRKGFDLEKLSRETNGLPVIHVARPGPLGNPFVVGIDGTRSECVDLHRKLLAGYLALTATASIEAQEAHRAAVAARAEDLAHSNVACWCPPGAPCHGDTLLEFGRRVRQAKREGRA